MPQSYFTTVREALGQGKMNLQVIPLAFMFAGSGISALLFFKETFSGNPGAAFGFSVLKLMGIAAVGILAGALWRSFHSVAWKTWALENVQDIHRLYQLAEQKGMINKRGSWFNNLEIATAEQRSRLAELETRLDGPRQLEGPADLFGPDVLVFNYSPKMLLAQVAMLVPFFGALYFMTEEVRFFPFGFFALIFLGFIGFRWLPRLGKPAPLRLDTTGIAITGLPLVAWPDVTNIFLESRRQGKSSATYLVVSPKWPSPKPIEIELSDIEGSDEDIEQAANDFWARFK